MTATGTVGRILIATHRGAPMRSVPQIQAMAGRGLVGDRHFSKRVTRVGMKNVTLIEAEKVAEFEKRTGLTFSQEDARRNIVTRGIELNPFLGREFYVGDVRVLALELCEPCSLLARRTHPEVLSHLWHKGGLRCRILSDGMIGVGDAVGLRSPGRPRFELFQATATAGERTDWQVRQTPAPPARE